MSAKYKRILIKLSGEAISGEANGILNFDILAQIADVIKKCQAEGTQIAVMIGAGNIWRGRQGGKMNRSRADHMGMLATTINSLALQQALEDADVKAVTMTSVSMEEFAEKYSSRNAVRALDAGYVVILGGGSGLPFFSTDTAAVLRAAEIEADVVLMAKNIDAIYTADPRKYSTATKISEITYQEILARGLQAMDSTATSFAMDNKISIHVFGLDKCENIFNVIMGAEMGTIVKGE